MSDTNEARWYVVHTYSGYENKVARDLATMVESRGMQDLIQDIKIPTETVVEIKDDKKKEVERMPYVSKEQKEAEKNRRELILKLCEEQMKTFLKNQNRLL